MDPYGGHGIFAKFGIFLEGMGMPEDNDPDVRDNVDDLCIVLFKFNLIWYTYGATPRPIRIPVIYTNVSMWNIF